MAAKSETELEALRRRVAELESHLASTQTPAESRLPATDQSLLAAIVESSDDIIISKDLNGIIRSWNRGAERIFGYTSDEVIGKPVTILAVPERVEEIPNILQRIARGERVDHYETQRRTKDGRVITVSLTVSPIRDATGKIVGASKVARDITEQKRAAELQERLAAIVESSDDIIISKDLNGIIRSWNRGAERIFGYSAEEVVGQHISMLAAPERVDEIPGILDRIRRGERIEHFETRRKTKDGRILTISLTVSPIRDASGKIIGASKVARDVTAYKQAEEERARMLAREQEARQTAELLNRVGPLLSAELEVSSLAQKVTDIATKLTGAGFGALFHNLVNDRGESYVLYTLSGAPREAFENFPLPRNTAVFGPTFKGAGPVRSGDIRKDPRYGHNAPYYGMPKGHLPVCSYLAVPVISRSGDVIGGLFFGHEQPDRFTEQHEQIVIGIAAQAAIALDNARLFTESERARDALTRANTELRRANDALEQFAFSASHDLKEPLRMVGIYSQLLQRKYQGKLDSDADEFLGYMVQGARRMEAMVENLLAYTQSVSSDDQQENPDPVDASAVLSVAIDNLRSSIEETGTTVLSDPLPVVSVRDINLLQLFQNVIGNAIKYHGQASPVVHVRAEPDNGMWRFEVKDNGIGIAPEYREQIFGIFKRLHARGNYQGAGIGLAICRKIVERYGGTIWVESEGEGKGSTFCFTLPGAEPVTP